MAVYDDQKQKEELAPKPDGSHDDLDVDPKQREQEAADLQDQFDAPSAKSKGTAADKKEKRSIEAKTGSETEEPDSNWVNNVVKKKKKDGSKSRLKGFMIAGGTGSGVLLVLGVLGVAMLLLSQLKSIHYATVLRSTGFAASQLVMRKAFATTAYNSAVLTDDSIGRITPPKRTMMDRLRRINVQKTMKMLGREGQFNIVLQNGDPTGFEIKGKRFMKDEIARETFPDRANYKDLSAREKLTVKNKVVGTVGDEMAGVLAAEPRSFNNSFFKGFRTHFNIRTTKWAQKARGLLGKTPDEARVETRTQTVDEITEGSKPRSDIPEVNEAADAFDEEVKNSVKNNFDQRGKDYAEAAFKKAGVDDIVSFSDTAGKVSLGVMVGTMYCTARDIQASLEEINTRKEEQAQRYAHDVQTTPQQIQWGDANSVAARAADSMWDGSAEVPPANQSPLYREVTGKSLEGKDLTALLDQSPTASIADTPLKTITDMVDQALVPVPIPGAKELLVSSGCGFALDPTVQVTGAIAEVVVSVGAAAVTGGTSEAIKQGFKLGVTAAVGITAGNWLGDWLSETISTYAGGDFNGAETGIDRYNAASIATDYQNAAVARGVTYAAPVSNEEAAEIKTAALNDLRQSESNSSFTNRYFAIDNPYSLVGNVASSVPSTVPALLTSIQANISGVGARFSSLLSGGWGLNTALTATGLQQKASAESFQNAALQNNFFGVGQWGWTTEELAKMDSDESFEYINNGEWVLERNANGELDAKYKKCYTPAAQVDVPDGCGRDELSTDEALHWRIYMLYNSTIDQLADTTVTEDGAEATSTDPSGTLGPDLPSGTKEELLAQIEDTGNITGGFGLLNTQVKRTTLAVVLKLAQKYKFTINSVIRPGAGPHGNGSAVDVGNINGKNVPTGQDYNAYNEDANNFVRDAATLLPGRSWFGVSNDQFKKTANDIMVPKGGSSDLDLPSTTGATGAHFHLNSPADAE